MKKIYYSFIFVIIGLILFFHALCVSRYTVDDAYISFRYAENAAKGYGLVFNPGERVEGYTNFLWVILLAGFYWIGANTLLAAKAIGIVCGVIIMYLSCRFVQRAFVLRWEWALLVPAFLSINRGFASWCV